MERRTIFDSGWKEEQFLIQKKDLANLTAGPYQKTLGKRVRVYSDQEICGQNIF